MTTLNSAAHIKQKCCVACVASKNEKRALYIASSESCQPNRNLFGIGIKLKESICYNFYSGVINVGKKKEKNVFVAYFHKAFRPRPLTPFALPRSFAPNERLHKVA